MRSMIVNARKIQTTDISGNPGNPIASHKHPSLSSTGNDELHINLRSGLWGVFMFLGTSVIALYFSKYSLASSLPADIMNLLGSTPPVILINYVFGASTLSSLIIIAGRIYNGLEPGKTSTHLWFRVFFYLLYFISGALSEYFNMVFISGLVVLGLQHYNVWNYYMRAIEINTCGNKNMDTFEN